MEKLLARPARRKVTISNHRIHGSGKGGGGGGSEAGNTLLSNATARLLDCISEGPIAGLVNGAKSIFLDGTPLQNADNSYNFEGAEWQFFTGTETQNPTSIIDDTAVEHSVNVKVTVAGGAVTRTLTETDVDGFRVRIRVPSLLKVEDDGDINPHQVTFSILWSPQGAGTFSAITGSPFTLKGKNNSDYFVDYDFDPPTDGPWDIRVVRVSADETSIKNSSDIYFDAVSAVVKQKFIYPWTSYMAWSIDAEQFGSSIPQRTYDVKGRIVRVPTNYNPVTRVYTGFWNGSFKEAWTDNPAWIFLDMFTNDRYGSGRPDSEIDTVTLYEISKYCDELVSDGFGGMEPRYTINVALNTPQEAYALYNSMLSAFRGMFFWANGQISFSQDSPRAVDQLVGPMNTETGFFSYTSSKDKSRPNTIYVQYNNPNNNDEPDFEIVQYNEDVIARGEKIARVTAWGCRSPGQAHRHGEWLLYTLHNDTSLISYTAGVDHDGVLPGHIIAVSDPMKSSQRQSQGRVKSVVGNLITLDRQLFLPAGTYKIMLTTSTRSVVYYTLQTFASGASTVTVTAGTVAETIVKGATWVIYDNSVGTVLYRVTSVNEKKGKRQVSALQYNPSKFGFVERDLPLEEPPTNEFVGGELRPPYNFNVTPVIVDLPGAKNRVDVLFSWTYPDNEDRVADFELQFAQDTSARDFKRIYAGRETSFTLTNIASATRLKAARIRSRGTGTRVSPWITVSNIELLSRSAPPSAPTGLSIEAENFGKGIFIKWNLAETKDFRHVEIKRGLTNVLANASIIGTTRNTYWRDTNLTEGTTYYYWVRARVNTDNPAAEYSAHNGPVAIAPLAPPTTDVLDGSITSAKIQDAAVIASKVANDAITNLKIADRAVSNLKVQLAALDATLLANNAVTTTKIADGALSLIKFATGLEPVTVTTGTLPTTKTTETITNNGKLYRWNGTAYVSTVPTVDLVGTVSTGQIADNAITNAKMGSLAIAAANIQDGAILSAKIADAAISTAKFASGIEPVGVIPGTTVPTTKTTSVITVNGKMYRWNGSAYVASVPAVDITGTLTSAQLSEIEATKVTGELQTGQIAANAITAAKIAALAIDASKIAANAITETKISDDAISTPKLQANSIAAGKIAANVITARELILADTSNAYPDFDMVSDNSFYSSLVPGSRELVFYNTVNRGKKSLKIFADAVERNVYTDWISVDQGEYFVEASTNIPSGTGTGAIYIQTASTVSGEYTVENNYLVTSKVDNPATSREGINLSLVSSEKAVRLRYRRLAGGDGDALFGGVIVRKRANANLIVDGAITSDKIIANAITTDKINAGAVVAGSIAADAITAVKIAANAISADKIEANAITSDKINANAIIAGKIAAGAISATEIAAEAIIAGKIAAGAVTVNELAANAVTAVKLSANAVIAGKIAANTISARELILQDYSNAFPDYDFSNAAFYTGTPFTLEGTSGVNYGKNLMRVAANAAEVNIYSDWVSIDQGEYYVEAGGGIADGTVAVYFQGGTVSSTGVISVGTQTSVLSKTNDAASARQGVAIAVPSSERVYRIRVRRLAGGSGDATVGGFVVRKRNNANLIVDGAITANKITTNAITSDKIQANAITTAKIAANAITATEIATDAITSGKIQAGAISADKLIANIIGARELVLADTSNIFPDFDFMSPGFYTSGTPNFIKTSGVNYGKNLHQFAASASEQNLYSDWVSYPGGELYAEGAVASPDGTATLYIQWGSVDIAGVVTSTTLQTIATKTNDGGSARVGASLTPVAADRVFRIRMRRHAGGSGVANFGGIVIRRKNNANLIVDGAITSNAIATGAIVADKIDTGAITAVKIGTGAVTAIKIAAATITGDKIAANTIYSDLMVASSITARELVLTDYSNVFPDTDFVSKMYTGSPYTMTGSNSANRGKNVMTILADAGEQNVYSDWITVEPGEYYAEASAALTSAGTGTAVVYVQHGTLDSTGVFTYNTVQDIVANRTDSTTTTKQGVNFTIASGERGIRLRFRRVAGGNQNALFGGVFIRRRMAANLIVDGAITADKLSVNSITVGALADGAVTTPKIGGSAVTNGKIANSSVGNENIATSAVTDTSLATNSVTDTKIVALAVTAGKVASNAISNTKLGTGAVTAVKIADDTITATQIAPQSITQVTIANGAIGANQIAANAVTAAKINVTDLSAISATLGNVDISSATIGTLTVGTSNIQAGAVSAFFTNSLAEGTWSGGNRDVSVTVTHAADSPTILMMGSGGASAHPTDGPKSIAISVSGPGTGTKVGGTGFVYVQQGTSGYDSVIGTFVPAAGTTSSTITCRVSGSTMTYAFSQTIIALVMKR